MKLSRASLTPIASVLVLLFACPHAEATPNFPGEIAGRLGVAAPPACTLCHATPAGGGRVVTPFAQSMLARGLIPYDAAALGNALAALEAEGTDSDGDGAGDIAELRSGSDPNGAGGDAVPPPEYGCGAQLAPPGTPRGSAELAALALAALLGLRRRRRSSPP